MMPVAGLLLFALQSSFEIERNKRVKGPSDIYYWSTLTLDRRPLHIEPVHRQPCELEPDSCVGWDPIHLWSHPGPLASVLVLSGLPAFLIVDLLVNELGMFGVSQLVTFMVATPPLLGLWYWFFGWLIDSGWMNKPLWTPWFRR